MEREIKYIVVKIKDAQKHLSHPDLDRLQNLAMSVDAGRIAEGKHPMDCVVVESDWPEYEPVWQMITDRVDSENAECDSQPSVMSDHPCNATPPIPHLQERDRRQAITDTERLEYVMTVLFRSFPETNLHSRELIDKELEKKYGG